MIISKKIKITAIMIILFLSCFIIYQYHVPDVHVRYYKTSIQVKKIPLRWGFITPPDVAWKKYSALDCVRNFYAIPVNPASTLYFKFDKPPGHYEVFIWKGSQMIKYAPIDNGLSINVPQHGGGYIFSIRGYYSQGEVDYVFWVDVI